MDDNLYWKYSPNNTNTYFCNICKVYCASALNLQTHFLGVKHKAVEEALKAHGIVKPLNSSAEPESAPVDNSCTRQKKPELSASYLQAITALGTTLEEQLNSCKDTEPAIGLEYITEYRSEESLVYECNLCVCLEGLTNMFMHVLGVKHRQAYLRKHHPEIGEVKGRGPKLNSRLKAYAMQVERAEGRKQIKSTMDRPNVKDDLYSVDVADSSVTWFTSDDAEKKKKEDMKPVAKEAAKCDNSDKSGDNKESEQSTVQLLDVFDSDSDSEEFMSNGGLLRYLKSFEIVDEDDAAFILQVTQKLTRALVVYRGKLSEKNNLPEQNQNVSERKADVSEQNQNAPMQKTDVSKQNQNAPMQKPDVSEQKRNAPMQKPDVFKQNQKVSNQNQKISKQNQKVSKLKQYADSADHSKQKTSSGAAGPPDVDFSQWDLPIEQSFEHMETNPIVKIPAKRKASEPNPDPSEDKVKTRKLEASLPTSQQKPSEQDSCDAKGLGERRGPRDSESRGERRGPRDSESRGEPRKLRATPGAARRPDAAQGPRAASRPLQRQTFGPKRDAPFRDARHPDAGRGRNANSRQFQGQRFAQRRDAISCSPKRQDVPSLRQNRSSLSPPVPLRSERDDGKYLSSRRKMDIEEVEIWEPDPAFSVPLGPLKTVWIIGHSVVFKAGVYSAASGWGRVLGLDNRIKVTWMGQREMLWDVLLPTISSKVSCFGAPDAIVIQLGEDDLVGRRGVDLTIAMTADIHTIKSRLPDTRLFWSDLLERRKWSGDEAPEKIDLARRKISAAAGRVIEETGGIVIYHPDISFRLKALFRADGVNLSDWGLDLWLYSVRDALLCWLQS